MTEGKRRVLLVDDEPSIIKLIGKRLEVSGFEVAVALDGQEALDKVRTVHPDVIVLDLMLPRLSGLKVCAMLKHDPLYGHIPIVIFTGKGQDVDEETCRKAGADAFVTKTEGADALLQQVEHHAARAAHAPPPSQTPPSQVG